MYKVRFHLAAGENFMKWQVKDADGNVKFYEPSEVSIRLFGCFLRNQKGTAEKIHAGAHKTVCAWVEAEDVVVMPVEEELVSEMVEFTKAAYNPKVAPNWVIDGENADGRELPLVISEGRSLYAGVVF